MERKIIRCCKLDDVPRGVLLTAGHHHFQVYYTVPGLRAGIIVSVLGMIMWLGGFVWLLVSRKRAVA